MVDDHVVKYRIHTKRFTVSAPIFNGKMNKMTFKPCKSGLMSNNSYLHESHPYMSIFWSNDFRKKSWLVYKCCPFNKLGYIKCHSNKHCMDSPLTRFYNKILRHNDRYRVQLTFWTLESHSIPPRRVRFGGNFTSDLEKWVWLYSPS